MGRLGYGDCIVAQRCRFYSFQRDSFAYAIRDARMRLEAMFIIRQDIAAAFFFLRSVGLDFRFEIQFGLA